MSFKMTERPLGDVIVFDLAGRIVLGDGSQEVRNRIKQVLSTGSRKILLNLGNVTYIDSSGLGELVSSYASVTHSGGKIKLLNVHSKIADLLQITKLHTVFESFSDELKAVESFREKAATA